MADLKISQLPSATTPLAGTEVLPIVQSSATKQVSIANLTAGRSVSVADATLTTGNLVIGTSGKGIDFSATGQAGGMTSELLNDYEEGTWTPTDVSGAGLVLTIYGATYTKTGRQVICNLCVAYPVNISSNVAEIGNLPFVSGAYGNCAIQGAYSVRNSSFTSYGLNGGAGATSVKFDKNSGTANATNADLSSTFFATTIIYQV